MIEVVKKYKAAWENKDLSLLECLFTSDAIYSEKPFEKVIEGIDEIKRYWVEKVFIQDDIVFNVLRMEASSTGVWLEWEASFTIRVKNRKVALKGAMVLDVTAAGQIHKLTEYFGKMEVPIDSNNSNVYPSV